MNGLAHAAWAALGVGLTATVAPAAVITSFTFGASGTGDNATAYSEAPTTALPTVTVSNFLDNTSTIGYDPNAQTGRASAPVASILPGSNQDLASQLANNRYVYFDVTVADGYEMTLDNITFDYSRGGTVGTRAFGFKTDLDGSLLLNDTNVADRPSLDSADVDLSSATYQGLTGTVRFQFYVQTGHLNRTMDLDNVVLNGEVELIPEPASLALIGLPAVLLLRRRRRN